MQAENLVFDKCGQWQVVEEVGKVFPNRCVTVFAQALVVETVDLGNLPRFMISTKNGDSLRVSNLECYEQCYCLHREVSTIDVVAYGLYQFDPRLRMSKETYP